MKYPLIAPLPRSRCDSPAASAIYPGPVPAASSHSLPVPKPCPYTCYNRATRTTGLMRDGRE